MRGILQILLLLLLQMLNVQSLTYMFRRTNILKRAEYWENNTGPCENDHVYFDKTNITTALIADGLDSQQIVLPNNGILFFGEKMELGKLGDWQCKKKQNEESEIFCHKILLFKTEN
ncbi:unnamed protein product [Onchocerca flexuosa]|uniref:Protein amnionless n=1 Tax=Onchocerca flexuosa TaxID=387005 RepID=A0A183HRS2_9BILA|nr:unnamed protein product [Onchocerca flexuosa]